MPLVGMGTSKEQLIDYLDESECEEMRCIFVLCKSLSIPLDLCIRDEDVFSRCV